MRIVTFDFHNTLVRCDRWFELEVRSLPWEVIMGLGIPKGDRPAPDRVLSAYKDLRAGVVSSGNEIDSYASVHHIFDRIGLDADGMSVRTVVDRLMREALDDASLVSGAKALVRELHGQGICLAVISSAIHHDFLEAALERFDIGKLRVLQVQSRDLPFHHRGAGRSPPRMRPHWRLLAMGRRQCSTSRNQDRVAGSGGRGDHLEHRRAPARSRRSGDIARRRRHGHPRPHRVRELSP